MSTAHQLIFDHCSIEFGPYDNVDGVGDATHVIDSVTFQNCLDANPTGQQFGAHTESVGGQWAWYYNVFANSHNRNPLAKVNTVFVNNVLYNCNAYYTTHTSTPFNHDIVNNYFILGPGSGITNDVWFQVDKNQSIYYSGNLMDSVQDGKLNGGITTPYWYQGPGKILTKPWSSYTTQAPIYNQQTAYRLAISQVGALPRDECDSLIISQMQTLGKGTTGTGVGTAGPNSALYTSQSQTGLDNNGYGSLPSGVKELDTDNDGMPDYWESAMGSNINKNDATTLASDGYMLIEHYINWLAEPHAVTKTNTSSSIDLLSITGGFANVNPVYTIDNVAKGNAVLQTDGHTLLYSPLSNFKGLDSISYTVVGTDSSKYSGIIVVLVTPTTLLPVSFLNFTLKEDGTSAQLAWQIGSDQSIDRFGVERSLDGINFKLLQTVYPNSNNTYTAIDTAPAKGINYYRLEQLDKSGEVFYSKILQLSNLNHQTSLYPNPTKGWIQIKCADMQSISVLDINGRLMLMYKVPIGEEWSRINLSALPKGNYLVQIRVSDDIITKKVVKE